MPQLYFTDLAVLRRPAIVDGVAHQLPAEVIGVAAATGLSDGMPFILDECGGYDLDLNRFFVPAPPWACVRRTVSGRMPVIFWCGSDSSPSGGEASRSGRPIAKMSRPIMPRAADRLRFTASPPHHGTALWRHWRSSMFGQSKKV